MELNKLIADFRDGDKVTGFYLLKSAEKKTTSTGRPFLAASLEDKSGTIEMKVWEYSGSLGQDDVGKPVKVQGEVSTYRNALQLSAERLRLATPEDDYPRDNLVAVAPLSVEDTLKELEQLLNSMTDDDYRRVAITSLQRHREAFSTIPAAKSVHHSFVSGLLMHTANMLRLADFLATQYGSALCRDLLLTGTLLHDFAKEKEFAFSSLGTVTEYTLKGELLGHLVMGARDVAQVCEELGVPEEKSLLLQHMVLSHHGEPDFGAAVRPLFAEAELLYYIDMIDSRMEIYAEALPGVPVGKFSSRIFALDKKIYHHGLEKQ